MPVRGRIKVETLMVYHEDGYGETTTPLAEVDIYLDKSTMRFSADFGGRHFQNIDGDAMKRELRAHVIEQSIFVWLPAVSITTRAPFDGLRRLPTATTESQVELGYRRFYYAITTVGGMRAALWETPAEKRLVHTPHDINWPKEEPFTPPCHRSVRNYHGPDGVVYYWPYTEALWAALGDLQEQVGRIADRVTELVGSATGMQALLGGQFALLSVKGSPRAN
jgi:hypothetical protein